MDYNNNENYLDEYNINKFNDNLKNFNNNNNYNKNDNIYIPNNTFKNSNKTNYMNNKKFGDNSVNLAELNKKIKESTDKINKNSYIEQKIYQNNIENSSKEINDINYQDIMRKLKIFHKMII